MTLHVTVNCAKTWKLHELEKKEAYSQWRQEYTAAELLFVICGVPIVPNSSFSLLEISGTTEFFIISSESSSNFIVATCTRTAL